MRVVAMGALALLYAVTDARSCGRAQAPDPADPVVEFPAPDAGPHDDPLDGGDDGGTQPPDAGDDGGTQPPDAGGPIFSDGGMELDAGPVMPAPAPTGWQFFGPSDGGPGDPFPREVLGVTSDPAGNIWVAGGDEGLFVLQPGASAFRRITVADGLTGVDDGTGGGPRQQRVISVAGGDANEVFVGYQGLPDCEQAFDRYTHAGPVFQPDPLHQYIWKSGDADRVTLLPTGVAVSHYDISSPPGMVPEEPNGREKLCHVLRIVYHAPTRNVWFGANHGVAWGAAHGTAVIEHTHPGINGWLPVVQPDGATSYALSILTDAYYGMSIDPTTGYLWLGGANRSAYFRCTDPSRFWICDAEIYVNKIDLWPDPAPLDPYPEQRLDDNVSDMAAFPDGTVWVSSIPNGLVRWTPAGRMYLRDTAVDPKGKATALERDPADNSLWVGYIWGGLSRLKSGARIPYDTTTFGRPRVEGPITDIQSSTVGGQRRILVGFGAAPWANQAGSIGIYTGE